jgi:hypothetical protein
VIKNDLEHLSFDTKEKLKLWADKKYKFISSMVDKLAVLKFKTKKTRSKDV